MWICGGGSDELHCERKWKPDGTCQTPTQGSYAQRRHSHVALTQTCYLDPHQAAEQSETWGLLRCLVTSVFCAMETKQQLGLSEPRLQIRRGTGSLPGPPQHWWLCPELLHPLEPAPAPAGQGSAGCSDKRGSGEGMKSELEQRVFSLLQQLSHHFSGHK